MAGLYELGEVAEEQCQQQHLNVRAIYVRVAQDADLAVAQSRQIRLVVGSVGIDADGHGNVMDFVVGKQPVAFDFPGVEHLATQRQDGLRLLVAPHLGAAACRIAFDQKDFVVGQVAALTVRQLARQHGHTRTPALFHLLPGTLARLRRTDRQFSQLASVFHMLVQPQLQRRPHKAGHQAYRVTGIQPLLDLALELRVQHLGAEHVIGTGKHVFRQELDAFGQQAVEVDEALDRIEQAVAQSAFMRAAGAGGNQVDVALAHRLTVFGEGYTPGRSLPFGKTVMAGIGKALALEQRNHGFTVQALF